MCLSSSVPSSLTTSMNDQEPFQLFGVDVAGKLDTTMLLFLRGRETDAPASGALRVRSQVRVRYHASNRLKDFMAQCQDTHAGDLTTPAVVTMKIVQLGAVTQPQRNSPRLGDLGRSSLPTTSIHQNKKT
ncbi:hypothetical protein C7I87_34745 [Mesorhizobium sp. SARCC-RB16n]|nr:hypothetical protein C7I87_34745 [Mesorhizobium sp. SARCC-RB16n]